MSEAGFEHIKNWEKQDLTLDSQKLGLGEKVDVFQQVRQGTGTNWEHNSYKSVTKIAYRTYM